MRYITPDPDAAGIGVVSSSIAVGALTDFKLIDLFFPQVALSPNPGQWVTIKDAGDCIDLHKDDEYRVSILDLTIFSLGRYSIIAVAAIAKQDILAYHYWVSLELCWLIFMTSTAGFSITANPFMVSNLERNVVRIVFIWCHSILTLFLFFRIDDTLALNEEVYSQPGYWSKELPAFAVELALLVHTMISLILQTLCLSRVNILLVDYYIRAPLNSISLFLGQYWNRLIVAKDGMPPFNIQHFNSIVLVCLQILYFVLLQTIGCVAWCFCLAVHWVWTVPPITHALSIFFFIWETLAILSIRKDAVEFMREKDQSGEGQFGFGQIVALTLLISPIIANAEKWLDAIRSWFKPAQPSELEETRPNAPKSQQTHDTVVALEVDVQE
ncbi:unnamed protein product [Clonostachys rosea]|uniref:Uncharacterized protein n=1 Tax=Bionectria ochroleuca TaxID=29856 RepID=A0ABY6UDM7_BIOOC|nr:unnamed protein product [Clonostachys rosea]